MISGRQIRAARGFLAWDRRDLAKKAVVTIYTIERIETGGKLSGTAMVKGLSAIQRCGIARRGGVLIMMLRYFGLTRHAVDTVPARLKAGHARARADG
jgi:hypothetical protein